MHVKSSQEKLDPIYIRLIKRFSRFKPAPKLQQNPSEFEGFSLLELITVLAGLTILTSIASTTISNILSELETDEIQAHLNSLAAECLKVSSNNAESQDAMPAPTSINRNLIDKSPPENSSTKYKENNGNSCAYFQVNPKDSNSETEFSMGFGIAHGKVTKFAILDEFSTKNPNKNTDIRLACKRWAGDGNCLENGSDYEDFFEHMDTVRIKKATCNISLRTYLNSTPPPNPTDGGDKKVWDPDYDKDCKNKTLPANATSYSTNCKTDGCTKNVKIKNGEIVGYTEAEFNQAQILECSNSIVSYINSDAYDGGAEIKEDLDGCTGKKYICDYREHGESSFDNCKIQAAIAACNRDLEEQRKVKVNGEIKVSGSGLPPCGRTYCAVEGVIYEGPCPEDD